MDAATLATALVSLGVAFGWQAMPDDQQQYEAIVQLDPELAALVAQGDAVPVSVEVPPEIQPIGRIRIVVGGGDVPRQRLVTAMKPVGQQSDEAIRLTQYNQPAVPANRYAAPAATAFDPYAKPSAAGNAAIAANPSVTTPTNPWTQPYQQAAQDVQQAYQQAQLQAQAEARQWAQQQAAGLGNQLRGVAGDALGEAQRAVAPTATQNQNPTIDQLFGSNAASGQQPPTSNPGPGAWNQNQWNQYSGNSGAAAGSRPLQRAGAGLQRAFEPIRDGVDRLDERLRDAAGNVTDRTRQLFDNLGRPIRSVADRQRSILAGRNDAADAASAAQGDDPRYAGPSPGRSSQQPNPFDRQGTVYRDDLYRNQQPTNDGATQGGRAWPLAADRSQDDRGWESTSRPARPWPDIPGARPDAQQRDSYPDDRRRDLAQRNPGSGDAQADSSGGAAWPNGGPQVPGNNAQDVTPTIERRMLAGPASAPVEEVADQLLRFPSDPVGLDLSSGATPGLDPEVTAAPFSSPTPGRPSAADLGWGEHGTTPSATTTESTSNTNTAEQTAGAAPETSATATSDNQASPLGLLLAWLLLSGSVAGNVYLFWSYLDVRNKYSSLIRKSARSVGSRFATA